MHFKNNFEFKHILWREKTFLFFSLSHFLFFISFPFIYIINLCLLFIKIYFIIYVYTNYNKK